MPQQSVAHHVFMQYFPHGFKLLLVGIDKATQTSIEICLPPPRYQITARPTALSAIDLLRRQGRDSCDLILVSDALLEDHDGYQFIRDKQLNTNIPHIVICGAQRLNETFTRAFTCGACYVLWKPMSESELTNLWQHVARTREQQHMIDSFNNYHNHNHKNHGPSSLVASKGKSRSRKSRFDWTDELHRRFVHAVEILGPEKAKPKLILKVMNEPSLTREIVSSHLQKYKEGLKRRMVKQSHQQIPSDQMPSCGHGETSYGRIDNNNYNNETNISAQPALISHHHMSIFHPLPRSPINPPNPESHDAQISSKTQPHYPHVQMQPPEQNLCFGDVHPMSTVPSSLSGNGTNVTSCMQDLNLASASSYGIEMEQHNNQAIEVFGEDLDFESDDLLFANITGEKEHGLPVFPSGFFSGIPGFSP